MKFYHCSKQRLTTLMPTQGSSRHGGEDPRAVGKAVVWLTNDPNMSRTDGEGNVDLYQHEVDIAVTDPDLFLDEPFDALMSMAGQAFGTNSALRWFFYLRPIKVQIVRTWDPTSGRYV